MRVEVEAQGRSWTIHVREGELGDFEVGHVVSVLVHGDGYATLRRINAPVHWVGEGALGSRILDEADTCLEGA